MIEKILENVINAMVPHLEPEQLERLIAYCQREDRAMSWVIRKALDKYLSDVA